MAQPFDGFSKLKWRCRRGTKELDFLLEGYLETFYSKTDSEEQALFVELLTYQDTQLILYLLGNAMSESAELNQLINKIRQSCSVD